MADLMKQTKRAYDHGLDIACFNTATVVFSDTGPCACILKPGQRYVIDVYTDEDYTHDEPLETLSADLYVDAFKLAVDRVLELTKGGNDEQAA